MTKIKMIEVFDRVLTTNEVGMLNSYLVREFNSGFHTFPSTLNRTNLIFHLEKLQGDILCSLTLHVKYTKKAYQLKYWLWNADTVIPRMYEIFPEYVKWKVPSK